MQLLGKPVLEDELFESLKPLLECKGLIENVRFNPNQSTPIHAMLARVDFRKILARAESFPDQSLEFPELRALLTNQLRMRIPTEEEIHLFYDKTVKSVSSQIRHTHQSWFVMAEEFAVVVYFIYNEATQQWRLFKEVLALRKRKDFEHVLENPS